VNVTDILNEVLQSMKTNAKLRSDVVVLTHFESSPAISGHRDKLKQAFLNIILNSYQAMDESAEPRLELTVRQEESGLAVRIRDSGKGMSESTRKRMFEPFHTTKPKGTGLGLAITHKILEGHRAQIFVESQPGQGTEFVLHFPIAQSEIKSEIS
jgi:two-component system, NtrC family, sensor histidine kinase PilS